MSFTKLSSPTGSVFVRNFDQGVVEALGAVVRTDVLVSVGMRQRHGYWIDETFTSPTPVPVIFNNPEQIYEKKIYPSFLITRNSMEPAMVRWLSVKSIEYTSGVSGTDEVVDGVSGFSSIEQKEQAWPFDIYYTVSCYARYEHEAIPMMKRLLKTYRPYSKINLIDSLGGSRSYTVFAETGVQDIGEFVDVADRLKAYSIDIRVEAELDVNDPVVRDTLGSLVNNLGTL